MHIMYPIHPNTLPIHHYLPDLYIFKPGVSGSDCRKGCIRISKKGRIPTSNPSKIKLFSQSSVTKVIINYLNINCIDFFLYNRVLFLIQIFTTCENYTRMYL